MCVRVGVRTRMHMLHALQFACATRLRVAKLTFVLCFHNHKTRRRRRRSKRGPARSWHGAFLLCADACKKLDLQQSGTRKCPQSCLALRAFYAECGLLCVFPDLGERAIYGDYCVQGSRGFRLLAQVAAALKSECLRARRGSCIPVLTTMCASIDNVTIFGGARSNIFMTAAVVYTVPVINSLTCVYTCV